MDQCSPGHWLDPARQECVRCSDGCLECRGQGQDNCLSCHGKSYLLSGHCSLTCPAGHYSQDYSQDYTAKDSPLSPLSPLSPQCRPCHASCPDCRGPGAANCLSCHPDSQLYNNTCHPTILHTSSTSSTTTSTTSTSSTLSPTTTVLLWLSAGLLVSMVAFSLCGVLGPSGHQNIDNVRVSYSRVEQDKDTELDLSSESEDENQFLIIDKI